jgi:uncharacterized membrane protein YcaP (DUF421 family)
MDIVIRSAVIFVFLFALMRLIGRRELRDYEPFDLLLLVVIGDLIQQGVTQSDYSVTGAVLAVATLALLTVLASWLSYRFRRLRPMLDGEPIILVEGGRAVDRNLRRQRITLEEVAAEARMNQIASIEAVRWAVLETNGKISFIPEER